MEGRVHTRQWQQHTPSKMRFFPIKQEALRPPKQCGITQGALGSESRIQGLTLGKLLAGSVSMGKLHALSGPQSLHL